MELSSRDILTINRHLATGPQCCVCPRDFFLIQNGVWPPVQLCIAYPCSRGIVQAQSTGIRIRSHTCCLVGVPSSHCCLCTWCPSRDYARENNNDILLLDAIGDTKSVYHVSRNCYLGVCYCIPCHVIILANYFVHTNITAQKIQCLSDHTVTDILI